MKTAFVFVLLFCFATGCASDGPSLKTLQASVIGRSPSSVAKDQGAIAVEKQLQRISSRKPDEVLQSPTERSASESLTDSVSRGLNRAKEIPFGDLKLFPLFSTLGLQGEITALAVTRDGSRAFIGGSEGSVIASSLIKPDGKNKQAAENWEIAATRIFQSKRPVLALALSPDEKLLAVAEFSGVFVLDLEKQQIVNLMTHVGGRILSLAWDPRGELLLLGRASGEVFGWRLADKNALFSIELLNNGTNTTKALEQYGAPGGSPILRLAFHPSARAFISASQDGNVMLWRLLRTEDELGLRDENAEIDLERRGSKELDVGHIGAIAGDLWFDLQEQEVFVAAVDGNVYRWRLRGLEARENLVVGTDSTSSIQGVDLMHSTRRETRFLFAAGRGQNLKLFCRETLKTQDFKSGAGSVPIVRSEKSVEPSTAGGTRIEDGRLIVEEETKPRSPAADPARPASTVLLAESRTLKEPFGLIRSGGPILWATQKKGNLVAFHTHALLLSAADRCPSSEARVAEKKQ